jgi:hypothetical protein
MKVAWLTDVHPNFLRPAALIAFFASLADTEAGAFVLTGDNRSRDRIPGIDVEISDWAIQSVVGSLNERGGHRLFQRFEDF